MTLRHLLQNFRNEYISNGLDIEKMLDNPIDQFEIWLEEVVKNKILEPNMFVLSTVSQYGEPNGRALLLKGFDENGFKFFTGYRSQKSKELEFNNKASMTFVWRELFKSVRIKGIIKKLSEEESTEYFLSRPHGSQISAWASDQSQVAQSREYLEKSSRYWKNYFDKNEMEKPKYWGGYILEPTEIEFWQGRADRLHDRIVYQKIEGDWNKFILEP